VRPILVVVSEPSFHLFASRMRRNITEGTNPFRRAWLRSTIDRVEVDADTVRIIGDKAYLEPVIAAANTGPLKETGVRSSVRKWRAVASDDENYVYAIAL